MLNTSQNGKFLVDHGIGKFLKDNVFSYLRVGYAGTKQEASVRKRFGVSQSFLLILDIYRYLILKWKVWLDKEEREGGRDCLKVIFVYKICQIMIVHRIFSRLGGCNFC